MSLVDISTINLIPKVLEEMQNLKQDIQELKQQLQPEYNLSKRNGVLKYLNISDSTINKYIKEGIFKQGYHYHREIKNNKSIIIYVSGAIEEFKKERAK
ncbi:hypothetical protein [Arcobacter sp. CECT 9188]|uniref:hypothetical protein n=1 Tax=Arcobacter sp. CECT 9188 TaxID=2044505 RepID=UPI000DE86BAB|nr:hypothetical protein [Arcobacter sp. CECT 9188]RBQ26640.1 hypothetical protein CRU88_05775 [Arcobacter sp. CECT 9188]